LARIDPDMQPTADEAQGLSEQLSDLARALQDYADRLEFNPERLQEVEERLELLGSLKRKYGDTIEQILAFGERAQTELDGLSNWEVKTAELEQTEEKLLHEIGTLAAGLSDQRRAAGERLARQVEQELADLRMERARFGVAVEQSERADGAYLPDGRRVAFDSTGIDRIEFLISANPGEPLKPMARVASGGETARLMLALKSVLAHADATPTLIFDEIDQGIGGRVGAIVGLKLWNLTGQGALAAQASKPPTPDAPTKPAISPHQVLCITHLPQLAAFGDKHFTVNKRVVQVNGEERTNTVVRDLDAPARLDELTLMLGATGDAGRRSVEEMMAEVSRVKQGA
jgi:DNA repair protein RecN (Recombination protein N)